MKIDRMLGWNGNKKLGTFLMTTSSPIPLFFHQKTFVNLFTRFLLCP
jgi:hypothetical protein